MSTANVVFRVKFDYFGVEQVVYFSDKESAYKQACLFIVESITNDYKSNNDLNHIVKYIKDKDYKQAIKFYNDSDNNYGDCQIKDFDVFTSTIDEKEFIETIDKYMEKM